ncbi:hypothetical protein PoB_001315300 [Plakobranchus ocellatus]|uniref:Uncharacterized protein n=1 Tax=Plakobranchus ocellatus TaxID=259542 RepID=A0AAV3YWN5_9GAST|nr:hypothetical protein PoB_001315300 [Plakobranchus ocellatus]
MCQHTPAEDVDNFEKLRSSSVFFDLSKLRRAESLATAPPTLQKRDGAGGREVELRGRRKGSGGEEGVGGGGRGEDEEDDDE